MDSSASFFFSIDKLIVWFVQILVTVRKALKTLGNYNTFFPPNQ